MALFGSSDGGLTQRVDELERRIVALERALAHAGIAREAPQPPGGFTDAHVSAEVRQLVMSGRKLEAIKLLCEQSGLGLKEAKEAVDRL